jgi:hypothetical protein
MDPVTRRSVTSVRVIIAAGLMATVLGSTSRGSTIPRVYLEAFTQLNSGRMPEWKGMKDAEEWLHADETRVEALVLKWMEAGRGTDVWKRAMILARKIPTTAIRDAVWEAMRDEFNDATTRIDKLTEDEHSGIAGAIAVLCAGDDPRATPLLDQLVTSRTCPSFVVEQYLRALQRMGTADSVGAVRRVALRQRYVHIDRLSILTERIIEERTNGRDAFANAPRELRAITRAWRDALEAKDREAYVKVLPSGAEERLSKYDFEVELLGSPELPRILEAARKAAEQGDFEIDRDKLEASVVVDGRYKFLYILEVDGWKTGGPIQIAP